MRLSRTSRQNGLNIDTDSGGQMRIEDIEYRVAGSRMVGHLAVDDEGPGARPAVLVCHEGPGLDVHAKDRAERLAGLGYAAFALDYHGEGKPLERNEMMQRLGALMGEPDRIRQLAQLGSTSCWGRMAWTRQEWPPSGIALAGRWRSSWREAEPSWRPWSAFIQV
jgi:hypothetical protein